ncbi:hypothetical protein EAE96_008992 [Botrytis aclada]|nr:hypothetical protein EAE96_008992 [Botrytis aclada]
MPLKRKAAGGNNPGAGSSKVAKSSTAANPKSDARAKTANKGRSVKFSNPETLSKKPAYVILDWQSTDYANNDEDEIEDEGDDEKNGEKDDDDGQFAPNAWDDKGKSAKEEDMDLPEPGEELGEKWCTRVSDIGFPISEDGMKLAQSFDGEQDKRHPNSGAAYVFNDFTGYEFSEAIENFLKDFDRDIHKKTVSPFTKWSYIEALAIFFKAGDTEMWMNVDDADGLREICEMIATMMLTSFEMLSEHNLFTADSEIKNIPIICLIFLEFFDNTATDLDLDCQCEILRLCDEAGIDLTKHVRKQVHIPEKKFNDWRDKYKSKKEDFTEADDGNGYKFWAEKKKWKPEHDVKLNPKWNQMERQWFKWDWKLEYKEFKKNHPGGDYYTHKHGAAWELDEQLHEIYSEASSDLD